MNQQEIKYYYYYGVLEEEVNYKKDERINIQQLKECILNEELDKYGPIEFNPEITTFSFMVAMIEKNNSFIILKTGEKGNGISIEFKDKGLALNYMLASLRLRKKNMIDQMGQDKKKEL